MQEHFLDSNIDGFVYFTVNVVANDPRSERELMTWIPAYRKEGDALGDFVNKLGSDWGKFYSRKIGQDVPAFQTDDIRILRMMRFSKRPKPA